MVAKGDIPSQWRKGLVARKTQVTPYELLVPLGAVWTWSKRLRKRVMILYIDHSASESAIERGSSKSEDLKISRGVQGGGRGQVHFVGVGGLRLLHLRTRMLGIGLRCSGN